MGTTASFACPVTTAASLSVSRLVGPPNADQKEEANFEVMWLVAAPASWAASVASAFEVVGDGVEVVDFGST